MAIVELLCELIRLQLELIKVCLYISVLLVLVLIVKRDCRLFFHLSLRRDDFINLGVHSLYINQSTRWHGDWLFELSLGI